MDTREAVSRLEFFVKHKPEVGSSGDAWENIKDDLAVVVAAIKQPLMSEEEIYTIISSVEVGGKNLDNLTANVLTQVIAGALLARGWGSK